MAQSTEKTTWSIEVFALSDVVDFASNSKVKRFHEVSSIEFAECLQSDVPAHDRLIGQDYGRLVGPPTSQPKENKGCNEH